MTKHRARTIQQLMDAAMQGEQRPCGFLADHVTLHFNEQDDARTHGLPRPAGTCPACREWSATIDAAYAQGTQDAQERGDLYDLETARTEEHRAQQAWTDIPAVEPAVSYLSGYHSAIQQRRFDLEAERTHAA